MTTTQGVLTATALEKVHGTARAALEFEERIDAAERETYPGCRPGEHYYFRSGARDGGAGRDPRTIRGAFDRHDYDRGYNWGVQQREKGRGEGAL